MGEDATRRHRSGKAKIAPKHPCTARCPLPQPASTPSSRGCRCPDRPGSVGRRELHPPGLRRPRGCGAVCAGRAAPPRPPPAPGGPLTSSQGPHDAAGGEVSHGQPGGQLAQLHVQQLHVLEGNCGTERDTARLVGRGGKEGAAVTLAPAPLTRRLRHLAAAALRRRGGSREGARRGGSREEGRAGTRMLGGRRRAGAMLGGSLRRCWPQGPLW